MDPCELRGGEGLDQRADQRKAEQEGVERFAEGGAFHRLREDRDAGEDAQGEEPAPVAGEVRGADHDLREKRQFGGAEHRELFDKFRHDEDHQGGDHQQGHHAEHGGIDQRSPRGGGHLVGALKIGRELVEHSGQLAGRLAGRHHGAVERREGGGRRAEGVGESDAFHNLGADAEDQGFDGRRAAIGGGCSQGLLHRHAGLQQDGHLAGEERALLVREAAPQARAA